MKANEQLIVRIDACLDRALVSRTEAKILHQFDDKKKKQEKKITSINKFLARLNKPHTKSADLKLKIHKSIIGEAMNYLVS